MDRDATPSPAVAVRWVCYLVDALVAAESLSSYYVDHRSPSSHLLGHTAEDTLCVSS